MGGDRVHLAKLGFDCIPLGACILMAGLDRIFISVPMSQFMMLLYLIIISDLTLGIAAIITPVTRGWLFEQLLKIKLVYEKQMK